MSLAKVVYLPLRAKDVQSTQRRGALQERENWEGSVVLHSHSGALCSRVDWAAPLVGHGGRLATSSLVRSAVRLLLRLLSGLLLALGLSDGLGILLIFIHSPVEDVIILETLTHKQVTEDLPQIGVVWLVIEAEAACVVKIDGELVREATAQDFGWRRHLLFHDSVVLLLFRGRLKTLPRQATSAEV